MYRLIGIAVEAGSGPVRSEFSQWILVFISHLLPLSASYYHKIPSEYVSSFPQFPQLMKSMDISCALKMVSYLLTFCMLCSNPLQMSIRVLLDKDVS